MKNWFRFQIREIGKALDLIYDPADHVIPSPRQAPTKTTPTATDRRQTKFDDVIFNRKTGRHYRVKNDKEAQSVEWNVVAKPTDFQKNADKIPTLTDYDLAVLDDKKANGRADIKYSDEKAALIKEFWYAGAGRSDAAKDLKVRTGEKGFSENIIGEYYAIFSKALELQKAPPIEA